MEASEGLALWDAACVRRASLSFRESLRLYNQQMDSRRLGTTGEAGGVAEVNYLDELQGYVDRFVAENKKAMHRKLNALEAREFHRLLCLTYDSAMSEQEIAWQWNGRCPNDPWDL